MLAGLRAYFAARRVLEVETPLACRATGTDPHLQALVARYTGPGAPDGLELYLQTSPEFAMKRLLADGCGPIYQICKAFRDGEAGRLHNPEFSMLEWYRPGYTLAQMIAEVAEVLSLAMGRPQLEYRVIAYADLFREALDVDVFEAAPEALRGVALEHHVLGAETLQLDRDGWLDLLLSHLLQPQLGHDTLAFLTGFPVSQAALARVQPDGRTAARFEAFYRGIELANGYHELGDADEQAARFEQDNCRRRSEHRAAVRVDPRLLAALQHGLPDCCGVAVGLDRALLLRLGRHDLDEVIGFSFERC
jgi:lysyl-tRNA synthetase class 2